MIGSICRNAWGNSTSIFDWNSRMPTLSAASRCPRGSATSPARRISPISVPL